MAARRLINFPTAFERVTRAAIARLETTPAGADALITIPCDSAGAAQNLEMQLRQYWKALERAPRTGELTEVAGIQDIAFMGAQLAARRAGPGKLTVEIVHRNQLASAALIIRALGQVEATLADLNTEDPARQERLREQRINAPGRDEQSEMLDQLAGIAGAGAEPRQP